MVAKVLPSKLLLKFTTKPTQGVSMLLIMIPRVGRGRDDSPQNTCLGQSVQLASPPHRLFPGSHIGAMPHPSGIRCELLPFI